jgi:Fic family protein
VKVPAPPPNSDEILARIPSERLVKVLVSSDARAMTEEYLPWDKFRFRTPPDDLTVEEWWIRTKWARRSVQRPIKALVDKEGEPFKYTLPDSLLQLNDEVTRGASGQIAISEQVTNTATRDRYVISSLIEEAITSSQLEGAATSRRVAKDMIRSGREPSDRSEQMIFNNYMAMRRIVELRDTDMTPDLVCEIHRIVTDGTLDNPEAAGVVQSDDAERIAVWGDGNQLLHRPPVVAELPSRLTRLCNFANGEADETYIPPALRAITIHFMMGFDHYFEDGNGRTARALFYWSMLREGFWLTEFLTISKILKEAPSQYARSFLLTEEDEGDLTHFLLFHLRVIARAIDDLHKYLSIKAQELREVQETIRATPGEYNYRQLAVLEHAVRNPGTIYTAQSHAISHNISQQSARNDLTALEDRGLLRRIKIGRRFAWTPETDISETLKSDT